MKSMFLNRRTQSQVFARRKYFARESSASLAVPANSPELIVSRGFFTCAAKASAASDFPAPASPRRRMKVPISFFRPRLSRNFVAGFSDWRLVSFGGGFARDFR